VCDAAKGFIGLGLRPFHAVGIMANNSPEWSVKEGLRTHESSNLVFGPES
jgi:hypothetical protein